MFQGRRREERDPGLATGLEGGLAYGFTYVSSKENAKKRDRAAFLNVAGESFSAQSESCFLW